MNIPHTIKLPAHIKDYITKLENETNLARNLIHKETMEEFRNYILQEEFNMKIRLKRLEHQLEEFKNIYPEFPK